MAKATLEVVRLFFQDRKVLYVYFWQKKIKGGDNNNLIFSMLHPQKQREIYAKTTTYRDKRILPHPQQRCRTKNGF